ncbi:MAG: cytochrome c oxidase accessory protein CcoG, partial [Gammaproteobacteria bacterium]|nr:cytochrome c oxidase accessory protein CcoG [Gammaproteobacteria bacterium]
MHDSTKRPESLYAKRVKIHAREVQGTFDRLRRIAVLVLLGLYYIIPWLRWNDRQAVLFDLPERKFYIFGLTLWPHDFIYLAWLLVMAALLLFFATAIAGRVWCGYACPQTVWTEAFVWIERLVEGNFTRRQKLDKAPWTAEKYLRRGAKQALWIAFALWTGLTFVGYFTPIIDLGTRLLGFALGPWETFWVLFYSLATYGNAGRLREQVCLYMCPYARFQSAMFDSNTLIVSYDPGRGEPRGSRQRGQDPASLGLGDCVDCNMCVQACPTGIDIRKGLQYECISCAACIDACKPVMARMGYPDGLIRYTTQNALEGKPTHINRPRARIYGLLLITLFSGFVYALANRSPLQIDVIRDRNQLYRETAGGQIENVYEVKLLNKTERPRRLVLHADGLPDVRITTMPPVVELPAGEQTTVVARVSVERSGAAAGGSDIVLSAVATDDGTFRAARKTRFMAPAPLR